MKKLNVAIIGQGRSGRDIHGRYFHTDRERFQVVAVVDALEDRRKRAAEEYGCDTYETYQELFSRTDIDLVVNSSFSYMHAPITIDLLNHGFHVLTEKPCARTPEDVQAMMDAGKKNNRMFAIFQQSRFAPYFEKVKSVMDSGVLGRIVQVSISFNGYARRWDWQCCQGFMGGNLYNTGPHPMDQALNLLDYYEGTPNVFCKMDRANTFGDAEDYVKVILTAPDRPLIDVEISSCDAYPSFTYKVQGTRGGLKGDMTHIDWKYYSEKEAPKQSLIKTPLKDEEGLPKYCSEKLIWTEESWNTSDPRTFTYAVKRLYDTVYDHLVDGTPLVVTPEQVKQQIAVINECHRQNPLSKFC
jgi:predicted dehydrogenase